MPVHLLYWMVPLCPSVQCTCGLHSRLMCISDNRKPAVMPVHLPYQLVLSPLEAGHTNKSHQSPPAVPALDGTLGPVHLWSPLGAGVHLLQLHVGLDCDFIISNHCTMCCLYTVFHRRPSAVGHIIKSDNSKTFLHQIIVLDIF